MSKHDWTPEGIMAASLRNLEDRIAVRMLLSGASNEDINNYMDWVAKEAAARNQRGLDHMSGN